MECISINATAAQLMDNGSAAPASADISLEAPQSPVAACGKPCVVPHAPRKPSTNTSAPPCGRTINRVAVPHVAPAAPRSETPFRPNAAVETEQRVPVAMTKAQRRHALCMQITEAARYQRGFYSAEGRPKETLQIAKQNSVTKSKVALHVLPALRVRKSVSGTAAASSGSYMMLSDTALTALLRDINLLLGPEVEKDYTPDVMNQVWGLKLYQPSVYPMFPPLKPTPSMTPAPRRPSV